MTNKNNNNLIIVVAIVAALVLLGTFGFGFRGYGMMGGYNAGFMFFNWIFSIVVIILIIAGVYWLIKNIDHIGRRR